jgi:hypothetical protein
MHIDQEKILDIDNFIHIRVAILKMKTLTLTEDQVKLLADAVWMRQRCFIAGDRRFKEYGEMLEDIIGDLDYTPSRY